MWYLTTRLPAGQEISVRCVRRSSCRSVKLRQDELAVFKAIPTLQLSPAILKELRMALSRRNKNSAVSAGSRSTAPGGVAGAPQRPSGQLPGKRKNKLGSLGDSSEPANRRPAPSEGSTPLPSSASAVTGEIATSCSRQLGPPESGATYAAVLAGPVVPFQPSGSFKLIHVQAVMQLRFGRRDQDPTNDRPLTTHFIVSVARGPEVSKVRSITELCGLRVSVASYVAPKSPLQYKRCQHIGDTQRKCGYATRCVACGGSHIFGGCSTAREQPQCCSCGGNHTASYRGCIKWKEAKAALGKRAPGVRKSAATSQSAAPKAQGAGPSAEQTELGEVWNHVFRGGRVVKATTTPKSNPKPTSQPVTEVPSQPKFDRHQE